MLLDPDGFVKLMAKSSVQGTQTFGPEVGVCDNQRHIDYKIDSDSIPQIAILLPNYRLSLKHTSHDSCPKLYLTTDLETWQQTA